MAIKDLRKLNEEKVKLEEAKALLIKEGYVVSDKDSTLNEDTALELIKESGYAVIAESEMKAVEKEFSKKVFESFEAEGGLIISNEDVERVEEAMKEKVIESLKEEGDLIISNEDVERVEEAMKEKVIESLKEEGVQILDEEMLDAIDEELERMIEERIQEAKKSESGDNDGDEGDNDGDEGDNDGDEGDNDGDEEKVSLKKESFLESLIEGPNPEVTEKGGKKSLLESLSS